MCGRFTLTNTIDDIPEIIHLQKGRDLTLSYNIAPSENVLVVTADALLTMKWGYVPNWYAEKNRFMINARSETIFEKPAFKDSFRKRRCIMLADGFYEWDRSSKGDKKIPHYFKLDNSVLGFGAIWDFDKISHSQDVHTCAIITTEANISVSTIHDRMPVLINKQNYVKWLNAETTLHDLKTIMKPCDSNLITYWKVDPKLNNARIKNKDLIAPID